MIPVIFEARETTPKCLVKGLEDLESRKQVETIPDYSITKISQNTEKIPGDLLTLKRL